MCIPKNSDSFITSSMVEVRFTSSTRSRIRSLLVRSSVASTRDPPSLVSRSLWLKMTLRVGGELAPDEIVFGGWESIRPGG